MYKHKIRLACMLLVLAGMLFSMVACSGSTDDPNETTTVTTETTPAKTTTAATTTAKTTTAATTTAATTTAPVKSAAKELFVNAGHTGADGEKDTYKTIGAAIKAAGEGVTVTVSPGTYEEKIIVSNKGLTLKSEKGAGQTTIKGNIEIMAANVTVEGFTIDGLGGERCIKVTNASNAVIQKNTLKNCLRGIHGLEGSSPNVKILDNKIEVQYGIAGSEPFSKATIKGNTFSCSDEAVGIGETFTSVDGTEIVKYLKANNTFTEGKAPIKDYRQNPPVEETAFINETSEGEYASLADALKDAKANEVIVAVAGTHEIGAVRITVKGLTLKSAEGAEKTLLKGDIEIAADDVTVDGFTIDGLAGARCLKVTNGNNAVIQNNIFKNSLRGVQGADGASANVKIVDNLFETQYGLAGSQPFSKATVAGNTFNCSDEAVGIGEGFSVVDGSDIVEYLKSNNKVAAGSAPMLDYRQSPPAAVEMDRDVTNETQGKEYDTLADALKDAKENDVIAVAAGTYEIGSIQVAVKGVTLKGAEGAEKTVLKGDIEIASDNVTIEGFTIDGLAGQRCIKLTNASNAVIQKNILKNCLRGIHGLEGSSPNAKILDNKIEVQYGIAGTEPFAKATITGNTFSCSDEAVGIGETFTSVDGTEIVTYLKANNTFTEGKAPIVDYRKNPPPEAQEDKAIMNETQNKGYDTLADALKEAKENDVIAVAAGTYEIGAVRVTAKGVTLKGAEGAEKTLLKGDIEIASDNVTVEGFTIDGLDGGRCVKVTNGNNAVIQNNIFKNALRGIQGADGSSANVKILDNVFESQYGVAGTEPFTKTVIKGNTFKCTDEAIGVGSGFSIDEDTDIVKYLNDNNKIEGTGKVVDYR